MMCLTSLLFQAAIAAAEENGRGVVFFPPGEFLVNTDADKNDEGYNEPIYIHSSNIVLRGSGSRRGGTIIRMVNYMVPLPDRPGAVPSMFHFQPVSFARSTLARITESAERETFWITVNNASRLSVGQWIWVSMTVRDAEGINAFIAPRSSSGLSELFEVGLDIREEHSIAEIQGNRVRLNEPLHTRVNQGGAVYSLPHLEEVGVEDISFHGSFFESFVHHLNLIHNAGWKMIAFNRCVNSWVRRVSFMHVSGALNFTSVLLYRFTRLQSREIRGILLLIVKVVTGYGLGCQKILRARRLIARPLSSMLRETPVRFQDSIMARV